MCGRQNYTKHFQFGFALTAVLIVHVRQYLYTYHTYY